VTQPLEVPVSELLQALSQRHKLTCECCGRATLAYFEPPNKVVIRAKSHGRWHVLTLLLTLPVVPSCEPVASVL